MILVFFSGLSPHREYRECDFGSNNVETCFEILNHLVSTGWQLTAVKLCDFPDKELWLPVKAFDGEPVKEHLEKLQQVWETLLGQTYYDVLSPEKQTILPKQTVQMSFGYILELHERINQQRKTTQRRVSSLYLKMDCIQARIQKTKDEWGVV